MRFNALLVISLLTVTTNIFAYGIGYSSHPLKIKKNLLSAEITGIMNHGSGAGIQGRFTRKLNPMITMDAGAGIGSGERSLRFFVGSDFEIFPDYNKQPRFSVRSHIERANEFSETIMILGVSPIVSKGMSFWGKEGFPYFSLPLGLGLNTNTKKYHTRLSANLGINGPIPFEGYQKFIGKIEAQVDLKNTYSGIFLGFSYPLD